MVMFIMVSLISSAFLPYASDDSDASYTLVVKDGMGREYTFDSVPSKIVTIGTGLTATAIELDLVERVIVCDRYSVLDSHDMFDALRDRVASGDVRSNGSAYSSGLDAIKNDIVYMTDELSLADLTDSKNGVYETRDVAIFLTGTPASLDALYDNLTGCEFHFKYVLCWDTIDSYDELIDMVRTMSLVMKGSVDDHVLQMEAIVEFIDAKLSGSMNTERRKAFYVTYSGGELKVGNEGSLANSMILAAGGTSITMDPTKSKTYSTNISKLLEEYGTDVVVFVDNTLASNDVNMDTLKKSLGGQDVMLVRLDPLWNNYCIESVDGVWAMACAMYSDMYSDVFTGDVPVISNEYDDDIVTFAVAGIIGALLIAMFSYLYFRA